MPSHKNTFKPVLSFQNRAIAIMSAQLETHNKTLQIIRSVLPKALARHLFYCIVKEKKLLLYTQSAVWASQLRFYSRLIQETVNAKADASITEVKVRIHMLNNTFEQNSRAPVFPASEIIEMIQSDMLNAPDSNLKNALIRLSETLKSR